MPFSGDYESPEFWEDYEFFTDHLDINGSTEADHIAQEYLFDGWFNGEASPDERMEARELFFEFMEIDDADFPWDEWAEWYEAQ